MFKRIFFLTVALALCACQRKHDDGSSKSVGGTLPGLPSTVITSYTGAVVPLSGCLQDCYQTIATNANVLEYPGDAVEVYVCRNAVCSINALPALQCSQVPSDPVAPCYTTTPSTNIVYGRNLVRLVNAFKSSCVDLACTVQIPGYSSYAIQTTVTR